MKETKGQDGEHLIEALLHSVAAPGWRLGLERIQGLMHYLGNPERTLRTVHVAGTNGKGSCTAIISGILEAAGYRIGCYLSPHIESYTERFLYNGQPVELPVLMQGLEITAVAARQLYAETGEKPTEFEILTAFGFWHFAALKPDLLIVETGLGGIYDATNIINPELSVITSISLDHTNLLGSTLGSIAANKAGIIKKHVPVALGNMPGEAYNVISRQAQACGAEMVTGEAYDISICGYDQLYRPLLDINGPLVNAQQCPFALRGRHQLNNLAISLAGLGILEQQGWDLSSLDIARTLGHINIPGRLELLADCPPVFLDVGHNPAAAGRLEEYFNEVFPGRERVLLCGYLDDKDRERIMEILAPRSRACIITRPLGERSQRWQELVNLYRKYNQSGKVRDVEDIGEALTEARGETRPGDYLLATGSFYLAAEIRKYFVNN